MAKMGRQIKTRSLLSRAALGLFCLAVSPPAAAQRINASTSANLFGVLLPIVCIAVVLYVLMFRMGRPGLVGKLVGFYGISILLCIVLFGQLAVFALFVLPWPLAFITLFAALWDVARRRDAARRERPDRSQTSEGIPEAEP